MPSRNWIRSRVTLLLAFAVVFLGVLVRYASLARTPAVLGVAASDGLMAFLLVACAASLGSFLLSRLLTDEPRDALWVVSCAVLGLGAFALLTFGLGLAGWLNFFTAAAIPVASALLNLRAAKQRLTKLREVSAADWLAQPAGWHWLWVAAAPVLAIVVVGAAIVPGVLWRPEDPHPYDVLEYHLQLPREWFELGRIVPLKHNVFSFFPLNAEMLSLLAMKLRRGVYAGMYLAQALQTASMALAVLGVYGVVRRLRGSAGPAVISAVAFAAVPWTVMLASVAYDESALLMYATLAVGWAALGVRGSARAFAVAGVFAGLACGVKYTAVPFLLVGIPAAAVLTALLCRARRLPLPAIRPIALFMAGGALTFSPWLVKNVVWAGNPVFPLGMRVLGHAHFTEAKIKRFEAAHSPTAAQRPLAGRARAVRDQIAVDWQFGYVPWPLAIAALCLARRRRETWFLGLALLGILVTWAGFTHLQSRFFVMAIPLAAILIGTLPGGRAAPFVLGAVLLMEGASLAGLHKRVAYFAEEMGQKGLFGLDDLSLMTIREIVELQPNGRREVVETQPLFDDPNTKVALIGNAQPFAYSTVPMSQLTYCTVFDVDGEAGFPDAWLPADARGPRAGRVMIVDRDEIERLARTYLGVPRPTKEGADETLRSYLVRR